MVVLKHGNQYNVADCLSCGAEIGYVKSDFVKSKNEYVGKYRKSLICPECGHEVLFVEEYDTENE